MNIWLQPVVQGFSYCFGGKQRWFPLLYFCTSPPPHTQEQTHTPLFLYSRPLTVCAGERKQDRMSLRTGITWMFCVVLCGDVRVGQATPLLLGLLSAHSASWGSDAKPSGFGGIFFSDLQSKLRNASLVNTPAENIRLLHGAGQEE